MALTVFLHMLGGWAREWDAVRAAMPGRSAAPELPGHGSGGTGAAHVPHVVTVEQAADHVLAAIDPGDIDGLSLVGTSAGGAVAARIAAMHPGRIASLTLISTALTGPSNPDTIAALERAALGRDYNEAELPLPRDRAATRLAFSIDDPAIHSDIEDSRACAGRWIKPVWRGVAQCDVVGLVASAGLTPRLIYGEHDPYRRFLAEAAPAIGSHEVAIVPSCGSFPHRQFPAAVARLIG